MSRNPRLRSISSMFGSSMVYTGKTGRIYSPSELFFSGGEYGASLYLDRTYTKIRVGLYIHKNSSSLDLIECEIDQVYSPEYTTLSVKTLDEKRNVYQNQVLDMRYLQPICFYTDTTNPDINDV